MNFKAAWSRSKELFKDVVRDVGLKLGLPKGLIMRHPFPGQGLAVRIFGAVTIERALLLAKATHIYRWNYLRRII
jgi:GMP synthase (glutamine-hydrolysing)